MALFSRRKKDDPTAPVEAPEVEAESAAAAVETPAEDVPQVNISVSTFRGAGAPAARPAAPAPVPEARTMPPAEAPAQEDSVPGLRDNVLLRTALSKVSESPAPAELVEVLRQLLQGHVFLRVRGDARQLLSEGKDLPLAIGRNGDDQYVLAFSSGAALQAAMQTDHDTNTSAMGQPVQNVLQHVLAGPYAGLLLDGASAPARALIPRALVQQAADAADPELRIKTLLATTPRTPEITAKIVEAMADAKLWVAVNKPADDDAAPRIGIAEVRTSDGARLIELFSHPLEITVRGRGDRALPFTAKQLARALRDHDEVSGVLLDGAGPWLRIDRADLAPLLPLADEPDPAPAADAGDDTAD